MARIPGEIWKMKSFTITKKIAKHGKQAIVVIPRLLEEDLKPGTVVKMTLDVVKDVAEENE
jgi:hypothetical protein